MYETPAVAEVVEASAKKIVGLTPKVAAVGVAAIAVTAAIVVFNKKFKNSGPDADVIVITDLEDESPAV